MDPTKGNKKSGSVAILGYYCVLPYFNKYTSLSKLLNAYPKGRDLEDVRAAIRWCVDSACITLQAKLIQNGVLTDDGLVECKTVVYETHVDLYLRLPASISIHTAMKHIRIRAASLMPKTLLVAQRKSRMYLFAHNYAAFSTGYDYAPVEETDHRVFSRELMAFRIENNLDISKEQVEEGKATQLPSSKEFLSEFITIYK